MRAAFVDELGPTDRIRYGELPDPVAGAGEAVVQVLAVAVDGVDLLLRSGRWVNPVRFPLVLGRDLVGRVVSLGPDTSSELRPGDLVWTNTAGFEGRPGATAELTCVALDRLYRLPAGADPVAFVATVHPAATAQAGLLNRARLAAGETVAVVGANGAVGAAMVQAAGTVGAHAIGVVRAAAAAGLVEDCGGVAVVADAPGAVAAAVAAAPDGVDVLVDTTGRVDLGAVAGLLNPRGRILVIATRTTVELDLWRFYTRELQLVGFVLSELTVPELAAAADWIGEQWPTGRIGAPVGVVWPFARAREAHEVVQDGGLPRRPDGAATRIVLVP